MARITVKLKDGRVGTIEDAEFDPSSMQQVGGQGPMAQTSPTLNSQVQPTPQPAQQLTQTKQQYVTGRSLEDHLQALQAAQSAGDKVAEADIKENYTREFTYQKELADKGVTSSKEAVTLRKEFTQQSKDIGFQSAQKSWNNVQNADKSAAGDLTVIYSYIKALDPDSVVREGEINLTKAAESVPSNIIRAYERAKQGRIISPQLRQKMSHELGLIYNERADKQTQLNAFYSGLATDMQTDPQKVIGAIGEIKRYTPPEMPAEQQQQGIGGPLGALLGLGGAATDFLAPEIKKRAGEIAQNPSALMSFLNKPNPIGLNTPPVNQETMKNIAPLAEAGLLAGGGSLLRGGVSSVKNFVGGFSKSAIGAKQKAAEVAAGNLNTTALKEAGDYFVKKINPAAQSSWKTLKPSIGKNTPAGELMEKLTSYGSKGYNAAGNKTAIAEGELKRFLLGKGREIVETQAPDVAKQTAAFKFLYDLPEKAKMAQKATWLGLKATAIGKMLGL